MTLETFLMDLGSKKGAPGGGAAAALTGATAAALVEMVARLNDARLKKSSGTAKKAEALRKKFQTLITEDAKAFVRIQKAYKFRTTKPGLWQSALKNGARPPLRMAELVERTERLAREEDRRTSRWLRSDLKESRLLLWAAFGGAVLNVEANLNEIEDPSFNMRSRKKLKKCNPFRKS